MKKHVHICAYLCIFVYIKNISANTLFYVGYNIVTHRIADATVGCCRGRGPAMLRLQVIILVACGLSIFVHIRVSTDDSDHES